MDQPDDIPLQGLHGIVAGDPVMIGIAHRYPTRTAGFGLFHGHTIGMRPDHQPEAFVAIYQGG